MVLVSSFTSLNQALVVIIWVVLKYSSSVDCFGSVCMYLLVECLESCNILMIYDPGESTLLKIIVHPIRGSNIQISVPSYRLIECPCQLLWHLM